MGSRKGQQDRRCSPDKRLSRKSKLGRHPNRSRAPAGPAIVGANRKRLPMRLIVSAVGRLKDGPERALLERYQGRLAPLAKRLGLAPIAWHETAESRAGDAARRREEEGAALLRPVREADFLVALDARGKALGSEAFARLLAEKRDGGAKAAGLLIGGPDGLSDAARAAAHVVLSFGAITLPHGLARIVLAEQLYRAATILSGHPYHRA
jgi:23S rRNA (pseudouridine1915-N3)-methyltransferase